MRLLACLVVCGGNLAALAGSDLSETRATLEKWIETRQLISRTKSDWQSDKESLEATLKLFERELQAIEEPASKLSTNSVQAEKERREAEALKRDSEGALSRAKEFATALEARIGRLAPQLPAPLQDLLKKEIARIPADPANTRMLAAERVQTLVGLLNEIDKFNNALNVFSERRKNAKGEDVAVETVYVGLGAAYFVNDSGDFAGIGAPGAGGWEWTLKPELAPAVREVVKIYRNEHTASFVALPAVIH
jgi:hypothetical protein